MEPSADRSNKVFFRGKGGTIYEWETSSSGYAVVWATENTREALFDAMERRETYATTGSRMAVRLFGGFNSTFIASGVLKLLVGWRLRPMVGWGWFVLLGVLSLVVGLLIRNQLPSSAAWSLGLLVGIDFLSTGLVFLRFGFLAGQASRWIRAAA
jgi:hypothetical protein